MVAPPGPDDETWKKMGKNGKIVYFVMAAVFASITIYMILTYFVK